MDIADFKLDLVELLAKFPEGAQLQENSPTIKAILTDVLFNYTDLIYIIIGQEITRLNLQNKINELLGD